MAPPPNAAGGLEEPPSLAGAAAPIELLDGSVVGAGRLVELDGLSDAFQLI